MAAVWSIVTKPHSRGRHELPILAAEVLRECEMLGDVSTASVCVRSPMIIIIIIVIIYEFLVRLLAYSPNIGALHESDKTLTLSLPIPLRLYTLP